MKALKRIMVQTCVAVVAVSFIGAGQAATLAHYDGIYQAYTDNEQVRVDQKFHLPSPTDVPDTGKRVWKYSDSTPISPTLAEGYSGPKMYAAIQTDSNTNGIYGNLVWSSAIYGSLGSPYSNAPFTLLSPDDTSLQTSLTTMIFFESALAGPASFDSFSSISLTGTGVTIQDVRFVVQSNGEWFITESITGVSGAPLLNSGSATKWSLTNLDTYKFASFDPENQAPMQTNFTGLTFDQVGSGFTDITFVGYYTTINRTGGNPYFTLYDFKVNAIPESSSIDLILLGSVMAFMGRNYRILKNKFLS